MVKYKKRDVSEEMEMSRADDAKKYFEEGYACAQAVVKAFADLTGPEGEALERIMLPFGGGIGRQRLTCGAVSGMVAVVGALYAESGVDRDNKKQVYAIVRQLCDSFKARRGSLICGELLVAAGLDGSAGGTPEARDTGYYSRRPCGDIVYLAAEILEQYINENPVERDN